MMSRATATTAGMTTTSEPRAEVTRHRGTFALTVLGLSPVPASRPRVTRWGTYYTKTYKAWIAAAEKAIPQSRDPLTGPLTISVEFVVQRPKTSKRAYPKGDIDNYEKAVYDMLTKRGYWHDDDQLVTTSTVTKRFTEPGEEPGFTVIVNAQED